VHFGGQDVLAPGWCVSPRGGPPEVGFPPAEFCEDRDRKPQAPASCRFSRGPGRRFRGRARAGPGGPGGLAGAGPPRSSDVSGSPVPTPVSPGAPAFATVVIVRSTLILVAAPFAKLSSGGASRPHRAAGLHPAERHREEAPVGSAKVRQRFTCARPCPTPRLVRSEAHAWGMPSCRRPSFRNAEPADYRPTAGRPAKTDAVLAASRLEGADGACPCPAPDSRRTPAPGACQQARAPAVRAARRRRVGERPHSPHPSGPRAASAPSPRPSKLHVLSEAASHSRQGAFARFIRAEFLDQRPVGGSRSPPPPPPRRSATGRASPQLAASATRRSSPAVLAALRPGRRVCELGLRSARGPARFCTASGPYRASRPFSLPPSPML